jgi:GntP family gluconate:H+ symporter
MQGMPLIIAFVAAIVLMILAISKWKIHPFLSIMTVSLLLGLVAGIPLINQTAEDGTTRQGIANVIGAGFSGTFTSIGIVIILGALIGNILEATGAAFKLADVVVKVVGPKHPTLAIMLMGWIVSIPVFCDSGFVILNPIRKAMTRKTGTSSVAMTVALSAGLYASHVFIPPTPGPIAAANTLYEGAGQPVNLLLVMALGAVVSIPALIGSYIYAVRIGKTVRSDEDDAEVVQSYEELKAAYGKIPGGTMSFAPIVVPILLMALGSISAMAGWSGFLHQLLSFLGTPIIALAAGTIFGIFLLSGTGNMDKFYHITDDTLRVTGPILFVTAAGGVLGRVIAESGMVGFITQNATLLQAIGIFFPFLLSAILKTAQGSSTVALTTTAGIMAPLLGLLGLNTPGLIALTVMSIGAGAMTVSHANDSYFWVVTNFGGLTPEKGYKTQTAVTLIEGLCSMVGVLILWFIMR